MNTTEAGTKYLTKPFARCLARPSTNIAAAEDFILERFPDTDYLEDNDNVRMSDGAQLVKFAGQLCYMALGDARTKNADAGKYVDNLMSQAHGSVLEHANYSFLLWGIDRAVTHELVRHRAGCAYSQLSQRYVGPDQVVFCEPFEKQRDVNLHASFIKQADAARKMYFDEVELLAETLPSIEGESKRDKRKRMHSLARRVLPNFTEAPIVITANIRAWRHVLQMRLAHAADVAIRNAMWEVYLQLRESEPLFFSDFEETSLPDGSKSAAPVYKKV